MSIYFPIVRVRFVLNDVCELFVEVGRFLFIVDSCFVIESDCGIGNCFGFLVIEVG